MSLAFSAGQAATWTGGLLRGGDASTRLGGVSIDTRTLAAGQLFVAIRGPHHDGHHYLERALEAGAAGLLVARGTRLPEAAADLPVVEADDTTRALGDLAAGHRADFTGPLVAITGSNGKTTTKEMCAAALGAGAPTLKTAGNLNNQFGLPLTLLARDEHHRRIVIELGMNHRGEIAELARIARPSVGAVTNVGTAHIEHLGSRDAIAAEKGDLIAALPADGTAVVNDEDDYAEALAARAPGAVLRFGRSASADVRATRVRPGPTHCTFRLEAGGGAADVTVAGLGETTVINALCAAAAALAAGAKLEEVARGLAEHRPVGRRLERRDLPGGIVLVDDSYNANPQSMEVALRLLAQSGEGRRFAVIGDMGELGETAEQAHRDAGRLAARLGIDYLIAVGQRAPLVAEGAETSGMRADHIFVVEESEAAAAPVREIARSGDWVLVKGSRAMQMERVAEQLGHEAR